MRKKALLVEALSSFEGPWINIEPGVWLVEPPDPGCVGIVVEGEELVVLHSPLSFVGPLKLRAVVLSSERGAIHLDIKQVALNA